MQIFGGSSFRGLLSVDRIGAQNVAKLNSDQIYAHLRLTDAGSVDSNANGLTSFGDELWLRAGALNGLHLSTVLELVGIGLTCDGTFSLGEPTNKIINAGVLTPDGPYHYVDTEGAAATDDCHTIAAPDVNGAVLMVRPLNSSRITTYKHGTGNLHLPGGADVTLPSAVSRLLLQYDSSLNAGSGAWICVSASINS